MNIIAGRLNRYGTIIAMNNHNDPSTANKRLENFQNPSTANKRLENLQNPSTADKRLPEDDD